MGLSAAEVGAAAADGGSTSAAGLGAALAGPAAAYGGTTLATGLGAALAGAAAAFDCSTCTAHQKKKKKRKDALDAQKKMLEAKKAELERWDDNAKANANEWFGRSDDAARATLIDRVDKELALNEEISKNPDQFLQDAPAGKDNLYAYVHPSDATHQIYLGKDFYDAPITGTDSAAGTLGHEMSHFDDIGGTKDYLYGQTFSRALARTEDPNAALKNADSFEYWLEH
jgi:hypothetical protein